MAQYTFRGRCEEDPEIAFDDGEERIFYNCCYQGEDIPDELRKLYDYIETGKSSSNLTDRIDNAVEEAKKVVEWRVLNSQCKICPLAYFECRLDALCASGIVLFV